MKKLAVIILMVFAISSYSQQVKYDYDEYEVKLLTYTVDGDTSYTFEMSRPYFWDMQFAWTSLDQTDGSIKILTTQYEDSTNFLPYANTDTLLMNTATGSGKIRDTYKGTADILFRINIDSGTCSGGTLTISGNFTRKR